jgi:hypothetical protein
MVRFPLALTSLLLVACSGATTAKPDASQARIDSAVAVDAAADSGAVTDSAVVRDSAAVTDSGPVVDASSLDRLAALDTPAADTTSPPDMGAGQDAVIALADATAMDTGSLADAAIEDCGCNAADASGLDSWAVDAAPEDADGSLALVPDFSLEDVNPSSTSYQTTVSPRDHIGHMSLWYFAHT